MVPELKPDALPPLNIGHYCTGFQVDRGLGSKVAVKFLDHQLNTAELTYRDLDLRSNQVANLLRTSGFNIGDTAFIYLPKCLEFYEIFLGILKSGLIAGTLFRILAQKPCLTAYTIQKRASSLRKRKWPRSSCA